MKNIAMALLAALTLVLGLSGNASALGGTVYCIPSSCTDTTYTFNTTPYNIPDTTSGSFDYKLVDYTTHWTDGSWVYNCKNYHHQMDMPLSANIRIETAYCVGVTSGYQYRDAVFIHSLGTTGSAGAVGGQINFNDVAVQHPGTQTSFQHCFAPTGLTTFANSDTKHAYGCMGAVYQTRSGGSGVAGTVQMQTYGTFFDTNWGAQFQYYSPGWYAVDNPTTCSATTVCDFVTEAAFTSPSQTTHL